MRTVARGSGRDRTLARGVVLAMIALALALGFCLFDVDGDEHHSMPRDLCLGLLTVVFAVALLEGLPLAGWAPLLAAPGIATPVPRAVAPPPESLPPA